MLALDSDAMCDQMPPIGIDPDGQVQDGVLDGKLDVDAGEVAEVEFSAAEHVADHPAAVLEHPRQRVWRGNHDAVDAEMVFLE